MVQPVMDCMLRVIGKPIADTIELPVAIPFDVVRLDKGLCGTQLLCLAQGAWKLHCAELHWSTHAALTHRWSDGLFTLELPFWEHWP